MVFGYASLISLAIAVLLLVVISDAGYYSTQCQGIATQCEGPTPTQIEMILNAFRAGGCSVDNTPAERLQFGECTKKLNPQLYGKISKLTNDDQQCKDETDFNFQEPGLIAQCEIVGTPLENCFIRCVSCLRTQALGFDPTVESTQTFKDCQLNKTYNYGTSS